MKIDEKKIEIHQLRDALRYVSRHVKEISSFGGRSFLDFKLVTIQGPLTVIYAFCLVSAVLSASVFSQKLSKVGALQKAVNIHFVNICLIEETLKEGSVER